MTTQARELAKLVTNAGDVNLGDDISLASDGAVLNFGADNDVTLTHVADTGLLLNSSRQLQFGDSGTFIRQEADGVLDLTSDTEIELNATTLDINANVDISGTLTVAGALDFGDLDISNVGSIALDTITNDGTDITLDSSGDIILDADGGDWNFKDGGTLIGSLENESNNFVMTSHVDDADLIFKGQDSTSEITALTLDMSNAGYASFNDGITLKNGIFINNADASATAGYLYNDSNDFVIRSYTQDKDIIFKGNDGGSVITAMTIDMSAAGNVGIGTTTATNAKLEVVATSGEVLRADANSGAYRLVADQDGVIMNGNVGVGNSNPQHPFIVHLTDGEIAMFGSNGMNSVGDYCGIGIGQVLANNTTYQKVSIVAEGRDNGNYVQNLHFLVDVASDANSAVLTDSKMMVSGAYGHVGIGTTLMSYQAGGTDLHPLYVQTTASNGTVATNGFVHIGPTAGGNSNADGYITGISLGYHENNASYQHTAIAVRAHGDGAARRDMAFLVNSTSEAASAALADAKLTISSGNGVVSGDLNDTSDLGFKENVADLGNTLSIVKQLKPRTFKWKDEKAARGDSVGFIAQEVKSVVSDNTLVQGEEYDPDNLKMTGLSLNTVGLVAYLTKAIQELSTELDAAKARITTLEG